MASIIDSFKEVCSDRFAFLKIIVLSIPVYYTYQVYLQSKQDFTYFSWIAGITLFFLFGFLIKLTNNLINGNDSILPSLNPFTLALSAIKGILGIGVTILISYSLANYLCSIITIMPPFDISLKSIIWLTAAAVMLTSFLMFVGRENILDAFNMKILFAKAGDLILTIYFFLIQLAIINLIINGFILYVIFLIFGFGPIFDGFVVIIVVFNICVTGHYMGQVHFETLSDYKNK